MKTVTLLTAGLLGGALAAGPVQAEGFFGSLYYQVQDLKLNDTSYYPQQWLASAGWLSHYGIGPEIQLGWGSREHEKDGLSIETGDFRGVAVRLQSPDEFGGHAWVSVGYGELQLDGSLDGEDYPGSEWFKGPTVTIGVELLVSRNRLPGLAMGLTYSRWFLEDDMQNDNFGLGASYAF
ncbi:hypothetical protein Q4485_03435 [Granulosicoccaceae sp. 1_MG-2023]|nr:hypothetical protein [Granulosicoccaceae sp. 1_MG-2023]